jgi:hypothetical protein
VGFVILIFGKFSFVPKLPYVPPYAKPAKLANLPLIRERRVLTKQPCGKLTLPLLPHQIAHAHSDVYDRFRALRHTVQEMEAWDEEEVLRWIQQKYCTILKGDNLENFNKACIGGIVFLGSDVDFYETCDLPRGVGLALKLLADKVKEEESKFIPRT